jgi:hypothetical protein
MKRRGMLRALVLTSTVAPFLVARLLVPAGFRYLWIMPPYPEDMLSYLTWTRQFANGALLGKLKYTTVPHQPFFFNPFFLISGWISGLSSLDPGLVLLLMKTLGVFVFLIAFERMLDALELDEREQTMATLAVAFTSGVGGFFALHSADVWIPEISTGWSLLWNPLYPWSLALTVATFTSMRQALKSGRPRQAMVAGISAGVLALIHPYHLPLLFVVIAIDAFLERRSEGWRYLLFAAAAFVPFAIYPAWLATGVDVLRGHNLLGVMRSPPLWSYLAGLGVTLLLAAASWRRSRIVTIWILCALAMAYAPLWFQRKLIFSVHIPVAILAGVTLARLLRRAPALVVALVPLLIATPVMLTMGELSEVLRPSFDNPFAISDERFQALEFLRDRTDPKSVVFGALPTMRLIPAVAGNTVPYGHWAQTVDRDAQNRWSSEVFGPGEQSLEMRRRLFDSHGIDYVMAEGPLRTSALLDGWDPVFTNREVTILRRPLTASALPTTIRGSRPETSDAK